MLRTWVVYDHPLDDPRHFVARLWHNATPTDRTMRDSDLVALRLRIRKAAPGVMRFTRAENDDPKILEVWL